MNKLPVHLHALRAPLLDLELQDLTGLVGSASCGRVLPQQKAARLTAPFRIVGEERCERPGIALVERVGGCPELVDHAPTQYDQTRLSIRTSPLCSSRRVWLRITNPTA